MALYVISCLDKPGSLALRMATREAHLAYAHNHALKVRLGGPFLDEKGAMCGSLLIVEAPDRIAIQGFVDNDPYVKAGLFQSVEVRPWRVVAGGFGDVKPT